MYTAVIVDDEPVIRFGIKASIDWHRLNVNVAGDFANGRQALQCIESQRVDLLITDIKMPVMDGLELARRALACQPAMKIVLVSSYNDFEYVREGLRLGVTDYILKPTLEPEELRLLVLRCIERLEAERAGAGAAFASAKDAERRLREQELRRHLLHPEAPLAPAAAPPWLGASGGFTAVCLRVDDVERIEEQFGYLHKAMLYEELEERFLATEPEGIGFQASENDWSFFLPGTADALRLSRLKGELETSAGVGLTLGYAHGTGAPMLRAAYESSRRAAGKRFFLGKGLLLSADETGGVVGLGDEDAMKRQAVETLSSRCGTRMDVTTLLERCERLKKAETAAELRGLLELSIAEAERAFEASSPRASGHETLMEQAVEYIQSHYAGPLTLQQVADRVFLSKNYFCLLFKKHTNQNFIDYVIDLRIRKAKELLKTTDLRIYEVAESAGFNDVKYFSKLFKKMTSVSPGEFREAP
ncbi:response regulator [Paenibacillus antri]|uniref:Response regulator n=1 Tax=Paenibacillus antri TaxID=2582848 RepID=A0A5R9G994_9BACL|nr:response regulator [Paenibacillus antri]TLS50936.1 response regulator [Paenibacillus antri]